MTKSQQTPEEVSEVMRKVNSYDTSPEIALQTVLRGQGVEYEVHPATLPGKPDIVRTEARVAVFVDGEFWHGHSCKVRAQAAEGE
jgi:DNA mismatch endonuclease, patch repair protein